MQTTAYRQLTFEAVTPMLSSTIENLVQGETSDESTNIEYPPTSACESPGIQTLPLCPACEDFSYSGNAVRNFKDCRMEVKNVTFTTLESFQFEVERRMFSRVHMRCSMNRFCLDEPWASMSDVYSDLVPQDSLSIQCFISSREIARYMSRNSQLILISGLDIALAVRFEL